MTVTADDEAPRALEEGQSDAVTVAFSDDDADVCGVARIGRAKSERRDRHQRAGAAVRRRPAGGRARRGRRGARRRVEQLGRLRGGRAGDRGRRAAVVAGRCTSPTTTAATGSRSTSTAVSAPAQLEAGLPAGKLGGMEGYDQLVRVTGHGRDRRRDAPLHGPRPARALVGRAGLGQAVGRAHARRLAGGRPRRDADRGAPGEGHLARRRGDPRGDARARRRGRRRARCRPSSPIRACRRPTTARAVSGTPASSCT